MRTRIFGIFALFLICFSLLFCMLASLSTNLAYAEAAVRQSTFTLPLDAGRGNFFDCHFRRLTANGSSRWVLVSPNADSYRALFGAVPEESRGALYENIQKSAPFLLPLADDAGVNAPVFPRVERYGAVPFAPQLLGYCDSAGRGVAGLDAACDDVLQGGAVSRSVQCEVSAQGDFIAESTPRVVLTQGTGAGVMLTLDAALQRACEAVAAQMVGRGCIVVLETATGRVRASVSMPAYDPNDLAAAVAAGDTCFVNRAVSAYNVGSVFKPLLAAAALESGVDVTAKYHCTGSITVDGHIYRCAYGRGHGDVDLREALAKSCNCYFITLGAQLGGDALAAAARRFGFGQSSVVYGAMSTAAGSCPAADELRSTGALASLSFGQGTLLASPVQVAAFLNAIANGGVWVEPTFVEGIVNEYGQSMTQSLYAPARRRVLRADTAAALRGMLVYVVTDGLGKNAAPLTGGAGGKTGTAQTGRFAADGSEIMDAWFAGFYPAEDPQYTIAVLLDSGTHSGDDAAKVFGAVANVLTEFLPETVKQDIRQKQAAAQRAAWEQEEQQRLHPQDGAAGQDASAGLPAPQ